ncbi:SBBP repeat-containing protein [Sorangium sp. So ce118]
MLQASSSAPREDVAAGAYHTLFLRADGTVWAWGRNSDGQLATGDLVSPAMTPSEVAGLPIIKAVAAGGSHSLALDVDGHLWAWGLNSSGQLGTRTKSSTPQATPVQIQIPGSPTIRAIAAGFAYSMALDDAGAVWTWGNNAYAQIGNNSSGGEVLTPYSVSVAGGAKAISAGWYHALAVSNGGAVWTWGRNNSGQIGDGTSSNTAYRKTPYQVTIAGTAVAVAGGASHSLALLSDGTMRAWGYNFFGQLGIGNQVQQSSPVPVPGVAGVTNVVAGQYFSLAMSSSSGATWSWGQNSAGQLGNGTSPANALSPTVVVGLSGPLDLAAGAYHATALTQQCPVWSWGQNIYGQLGLGGSPEGAAHPTPAQSDVLRALYFDGDMDGHGDADALGDPWQTIEGCSAELGWVANAADCEDFDVAIYPGAEEICNGLDENCSGEADEGSHDAGGACDTDEPGVCAPGAWTCVDGTLACEQVVQASPEACDGLDNDCNGVADNGGAACSTGLPGVCSAGTTACVDGEMTCDQSQQPSIEACDTPVDENCDGSASCVGAHVWSKRFGGSPDDRVEDLAADADGNVLVAGFFHGNIDFGGGLLANAGESAAALAKVDPAGNHLWSKRFGGQSSNASFAVAVDPWSDVLLGGIFKSNIDFGGGVFTSAGDTDIFMAKFDSDGNHIWSRRFGGVGTDFIYGVAVDAAGNVLITGGFSSTVNFGGGPLTSADGEDLFVAKFTSAGTHVWSKSFTNVGFARGFQIAVDAAGDALITGHCVNTVNFDGGLIHCGVSGDIFLAKLTSTGIPVWSKRMGGTAQDLGYSIAVDSTRKVLVAGSFQWTADLGDGPVTAAGLMDIVVAQFDPDGAHLWSKHIGGTGSDHAPRIAVDPLDNVLLTGHFENTVNFGGGPLTSAGSRDLFAAKYTTTGAHLWSQRFGGSGLEDTGDITTDAMGNVLLGGNFQGTADLGGGPLTSAGSLDMVVAKFKP